MTGGGCCFDCQGKLAKPRRRKLGAFPTNYGTPRKAFKLSFSMPCHRSSLLPSTTTRYILKLVLLWNSMLCYVVWLCYIPQLCKAVRATVLLLDRASCCCCFPSDQKGTRKGRRRCFRPINLLGRTSNFQTFKSFLMSRRSSSSIAIRCTLGMLCRRRSARFRRRRRFLGDAAPAPATSLSLFLGAIISPGLSCHLG